MTAQDPKGGQKYWFDGLPFSGVENSAASTGEVKFWFNGLPASSIFPSLELGDVRFSLSASTHPSVMRTDKIIGY